MVCPSGADFSPQPDLSPAPGVAEVRCGLKSAPARQTAAAAAREFEAMLLQHLLQTAREKDANEISGEETYLEMAEQQLARALAERGGLGLARMILKNLRISETSTDKQMEGDR